MKGVILLNQKDPSVVQFDYISSTSVISTLGAQFTYLELLKTAVSMANVNPSRSSLRGVVDTNTTFDIDVIDAPSFSIVSNDDDNDDGEDVGLDIDILCDTENEVNHTDMAPNSAFNINGNHLTECSGSEVEHNDSMKENKSSFMVNNSFATGSNYSIGSFPASCNLTLEKLGLSRTVLSDLKQVIILVSRQHTVGSKYTFT